MWLLDVCFSAIMQFWCVDVRISQSISESPLDFEITRVDCFYYLLFNCSITKTRLYSFDPLKPHFYIGKLGFTGVYIIFLISAQKHRLWVLVRTASAEAVLTSTHNLCFKQKYEKYQSFLSENFQVLEVKFSIYLNRHVSVMVKQEVNGF